MKMYWGSGDIDSPFSTSALDGDEWSDSRSIRFISGKRSVDERIILKYILEIQNGVVWTGLTWLRIGTSGGHL
jgi:hypothetical protein